MNSTNLKPVNNQRWAYHVFTPALMHRLKASGKLQLPTVALRSSLNNYNSFVLVDRIKVKGPSELTCIYDTPLPGTNGRGVNICFTESPVEIFYKGHFPISFFCDNKTSEDLLKEVLKVYRNKSSYFIKRV